jgi:hypothetical protein
MARPLAAFLAFNFFLKNKLITIVMISSLSNRDSTHYDVVDISIRTIMSRSQVHDQFNNQLQLALSTKNIPDITLYNLHQ